ncbi:MAG: PQQ-binding-like beta-propeller repeat protein [Anaerolineales bacterium]|nr:PQQ-binding-like beta-propeller repeat protein [Anaerolineales bacterium]
MTRRPLVPGTSAPNRPALLWAALLTLALAIGVGVASLLVFSAKGGATLTPQPALDQRVVVGAALDDHTVVVGSVTNELVVWENGQRSATLPLAFLVGALTVKPDGQFVVGLVNGQVQTYDQALTPGLGWKLPGRITGLAARSDGGLVLTTGSGPAAHDFAVQQYDPAGTLLAETPVDFPTRGVAVFGGQAIFINTKGEVGAIDAAGQQVWTTNAPQSLLSVAAAADDSALYVGDERGGLTRLAPDGSVVWTQTLTEYELDVLYALPGGAGVVAGARDGSIFALDGDGELQFSQRAVDAGIKALVPAQSGNVLALANNGDQFAVNVATLQFAPARQAWQVASYIAIGVLVLATIGLALAGGGRTSAATGLLARRVYRARLSYLFIAPAIILMLVFTYWPALMAFYVSLTDFNLSSPMEFIGLRNFENMLRDTYLLAGVKNMVILLLTNVAKQLTIPLLVAELIFWIRSEVLKYWFRTAFVLPAIVPGIVAILLWKTIWAPNIGLVNQILQLVGQAQMQRAWLGEDATALLAVILTGFPWVDIFAFLVFFGGLLTISGEVFDAAAVDGASPLRRFFAIDIPGLWPQIMLVLFFAFIGSIQGFEGIFVLTGGGPGTVTYVPALEMYVMISKTAKFGYASAIGFALAAIIAVLVFLRFRLDPQRGEQEGTLA